MTDRRERVVDARSYHPAVEGLRNPLVVRAVFERSWHLVDAAGWIVTVSSLPWDGPLTVRVAAPHPALPVHPGMAAEVAGHELLLEGIRVRLGGADRWPSPTAETDLLRLSAPVLQRDLAALGTRIGVSDLTGTLGSRVRDLGHALHSGRTDLVAAAALGLLGLGPGLTPSGDDVLVGCLCALQTLAARAPLCTTRAQALSEALTGAVLDAAAARTTSLSRTLLHYAARGLAAQPLVEVTCTLGSGQPVRRIDAVLSLGHTSGRDMLVGVLLAAAAVLEGEEAGGPSLVRPA